MVGEWQHCYQMGNYKTGVKNCVNGVSNEREACGNFCGKQCDNFPTFQWVTFFFISVVSGEAVEAFKIAWKSETERSEFQSSPKTLRQNVLLKPVGLLSNLLRHTQMIAKLLVWLRWMKSRIIWKRSGTLTFRSSLILQKNWGWYMTFCVLLQPTGHCRYSWLFRWAIYAPLPHASCKSHKNWSWSHFSCFRSFCGEWLENEYHKPSSCNKENIHSRL